VAHAKFFLFSFVLLVEAYVSFSFKSLCFSFSIMWRRYFFLLDSNGTRHSLTFTLFTSSKKKKKDTIVVGGYFVFC